MALTTSLLTRMKISCAMPQAIFLPVIVWKHLHHNHYSITAKCKLAKYQTNWKLKL
jgi:hypothetical protein